MYFSCVFYDALFHYAYGLKSTILSGNDYEIPYKLNLFMKQEKFTGCSGLVAFE